MFQVFTNLIISSGECFIIWPFQSIKTGIEFVVSLETCTVRVPLVLCVLGYRQDKCLCSAVPRSPFWLSHCQPRLFIFCVNLCSCFVLVDHRGAIHYVKGCGNTLFQKGNVFSWAMPSWFKGAFCSLVVTFLLPRLLRTELLAKLYSFTEMNRIQAPNSS